MARKRKNSVEAVQSEAGSITPSSEQVAQQTAPAAPKARQSYAELLRTNNAKRIARQKQQANGK